MWRNIFLAVFICAVCQPFAVAQTNGVTGTFVGTHIDQNVRWTKAGSPYIITIEVTIHKEATLTIEPGVEVFFSPETRLVVEGGILAQGTKSKKIVFEGLNGCNWNGFLLTNTCEQYDPSTQAGCMFEHCSFKGTGDAPTHLIRSRGCNLKVANCTVENCYTAIQSERQAYIYVENNSFKYCDRALNIRNTSMAHVHHNKMFACNSVMIGGTTKFEYNKLKKFTAVGRHSGVIVWMLGGGIVEIENNDFVKFEDTAIKLQKMSRRSTFTLSNNTFKDNDTNLKLSCKYFNHGKTTIEQNNFYNYKTYHVKLFSPCADDKTETCVIGNNYWGKISQEQLQQATFDNRSDSTLTGTVQYSNLSSKTFEK